MARVYRQVERAVEHLQRTLGALSSCSGEEGAAYAFACGYAQYGIVQALTLLGAGEDVTDGTAFIEGYEAVTTEFQDELPFGEGDDGR
jgi:hypothetical protein